MKLFPALIIFLGVLLVAVSLNACRSPDQVSDKELSQILPAEMRDLVATAEKRGVLLIDTRSADAFAAGAIPGAVNIAMQDLKAGDPVLNKAKLIVVYGRTWSDSISPAAAKKLIKLGYGNVRDFRGGWEAWSKRGAE